MPATTRVRFLASPLPHPSPFAIDVRKSPPCEVVVPSLTMVHIAVSAVQMAPKHVLPWLCFVHAERLPPASFLALCFMQDMMDYNKREGLRKGGASIPRCFDGPVMLWRRWARLGTAFCRMSFISPRSTTSGRSRRRRRRPRWASSTTSSRYCTSEFPSLARPGLVEFGAVLFAPGQAQDGA